MPSMVRFCSFVWRQRWPVAAVCLICLLLIVTLSRNRLDEQPQSQPHQVVQTFNSPIQQSKSSIPSLIVYNRVPKTGSTSFVNMAYDLCWSNQIHVIHISTSRNQHVLTLANQAALVHNLTGWREMQPMMVHGHVAYLDFGRLGSPLQPLHINIIRDPLERLISYFYFLRFGDDYRPHLVRKRMRNKRTQQMTFDQCVEQGHKDCSEKSLWLQVPFFCGHDAHCWQPGNREALEQAKRNLVDKYFLVGITEELGDFIILLESALPRFFRGLTAAYRSREKSHLRRTSHKVPPSQATIEKLKKTPAWQLEQEFYNFAKRQFHYARNRAFTKHGDGAAADGADLLEWREQRFVYEKVRPKRPFVEQAAAPAAQAGPVNEVVESNSENDDKKQNADQTD
ncbi:hypothetical protein BOX15_Mlig018388g2 [Macrostomum lignano]|uniref:Uncharacterized protein n=2 Tax=Macrostomum lignano TaxID=282301 RepID=A0A267EDP1_9PLAT|nr:hypothetical protein BOX15_Mlig018388g2 [Macrostomum lignano]